MEDPVVPFAGFYAETYRQLRADGPGADLPLIDARQAAMPPREAHWEFAAIALLHVATEDGRPLLDPARSRLDRWHSRFHPNHPAGNWRLMRSAVEAALAGRPLDHARLVAALGQPGADGHLPDVQGEISSQYHAYNLLLLARFGTPEPKVCDAVRAGFTWLFEVDRAYGDPSPLGRGCFQTFGYAAMLAASRYAGTYGVRVPAAWLSRVATRLAGVLPNSGALPPFWDGPYRPHLLHGYNTIDDYPAFAEFWAPTQGAPAAFTGAPPARFVLRADWGTLAYDSARGPLLFLPQVPCCPDMLSRLLGRLGLRKPSAPVPALADPAGRDDVCLQGDVSQCVWSRMDGRVAPAAGRVTAGSPEQSTLAWSGPTGAAWSGREIRLARRGSLIIPLR